VRIKRLDIMRCAAILLVLFHHSAVLPSISQMGYVGVDMFFVLSGFLISGLLYTEYQQRGAISFKRFFIRRGFKIYPAFYAMLLVTFIVQLAAGKLSGWAAYAREILFVQDYKPAIWLHCWSLGVEEHFYILLPILLLLLIRFSSNSANPFKAIPRTFLVVAVACFAMRAATVHFTPPASYYGDTISMPTHLRIDGLFFGVLLGYLYSFHRQGVDDFMRPIANRLMIGLATVALLSTCFIFQGTNRFYVVFGPTFLYLGFGGLLLLCLYVRDVLPQRFAGPLAKLGTACAFVGLYSYSIYLWQGVFGIYTIRGFKQFFHIELKGFPFFAWYFFGCVIFGIVMARLIEFPVLRMRERFFPPEQAAVAAPPTGATYDAEALISAKNA
jgi:peptidoglycan/LPS O-acetylase OafA/YrhL